MAMSGTTNTHAYAYSHTPHILTLSSHTRGVLGDDHRVHLHAILRSTPTVRNAAAAMKQSKALRTPATTAGAAGGATARGLADAEVGGGA